MEASLGRDEQQQRLPDPSSSRAAAQQRDDPRQAAAHDQPGPSRQQQEVQEEEEEEEQEYEPFVNTGLAIWLERQREWRSAGGGEDAFRQHEERRKRKRSYTPTVTPEQLLSMQPLPHPVPLEEAVEVLAELWENEEPF